MENYAVESFDFIERSSRSASFRMPSAHFHKHHELYYLLKGKTQYCIENELYFLEPGDMIFVPSGVFHQTSNTVCDDMERLLINFNDSTVVESFKPYIDYMAQHKHIRLPKAGQSACRNLFHLMEEETQKHEVDYRLMRELLLGQLLLTISRYRMDDIATHFSPSCQVIREAVRQIGMDYRHEWTLDELCCCYSLSRSYFSKLFNKVMGTGLSEYINAVRINAARDMLAADCSLSITDVAQRCGFHDSNYFAMVFKRLIGLTPKKYALSIRDGQRR